MASELVQACSDKDLERLKQLRSSPQVPQYINSLVHVSGMTPLNYACKVNAKEYVRVLLDHHAKDDIIDEERNCAIHHAIESDTDALPKVQCLVQHDPRSIHLKASDNSTPLICASNIGNNDMVCYLLRKGADVTAVDVKGWSALHYAAAWRSHAVITTLLNSGACPSQKDRYGNTPVHEASKDSDLETVKLLTASPLCDLTIKNNDGETALDLARSMPYKRNDDPVIEYLDDITKNPNNLVVQQVSSVHRECEALMKNNSSMSSEQCRRCEGLERQIQELEKRMKELENAKEKEASDATKAKVAKLESDMHHDNNMIRQLQEEVKRLHGENLKLKEAVRKSSSETAASASQPKHKVEFTGILFRYCFLL